MTVQMMTSECLRTAFLTAILLTGSVRQAETAVLEGIRSLNIDAASEEEILRTSAAAALHARQRYRRRPGETAQSSSLVPGELRRVLQLPSNLRHCFVLRFLIAMPREFCAQLLGLDASALDRDTWMAARALAQIVQKKQADEQAQR